MKKKTAGLLALLFAMTMALTGCSGSNTVDSAAEAANVEGASIPLGEVNFWLRYQQTQMQSMYGSLFGEDFMNQDLTGTGSVYGEMIRDAVLDTLEEYYVVEAHAEELGVTLSDEEKTAAADAAKAFISANDSRTLAAMSADEATVTHVLEMTALQEKVYENLAATIDTEVDPEEAAQKRISYVLSSTAGTTDADGNTTELTEDELAEKKREIEAVLAEAEESGDLSAAAEAHGLTATTTTYGKDGGSLNEEVTAAADTLSDGEFSQVIETENGYYVVYMESTYDEEATQSEVQSILSQREQEAYSAWLDPLKEAANISVNEDVVGTLTFERIFNVPAAEEDTAADGAETGEEASDSAVTEE